MLFLQTHKRKTVLIQQIKHNKCGRVMQALGHQDTMGWGEERTQHQWWSARSPYSRCRRSAAAGSWRCQQCTWGRGRRWCVSQTGTLGCYTEVKAVTYTVHLFTHTVHIVCVDWPLRGLSQVSDKVLLSDHKVDDPGEGSRSFEQTREELNNETLQAVACTCALFLLQTLKTGFALVKLSGTGWYE